MSNRTIFLLKGFLFLVLAGAVESSHAVHSQPLFDGFNAYCTSNKDYTGSCTNVENQNNKNSKQKECLIRKRDFITKHF